MRSSSTHRDPNRQAAQRWLSLSRRRFLRGLGATIALPAMNSLLPMGERSVLAAPNTSEDGSLAATAGGAPLRMATVYVPNGAIPENWWPIDEPSDAYTLNHTMQPLAELKDTFQILGGLECRAADPGADGGGDHARAGGSFLTGVRSKKSQSDVRAGVSIDQVIAEQVGHLTPFRSLELSCESAHLTGGCDSGYACAYSYNLSWKTPTSPITPEANPRHVFERMFGYGSDGNRDSTLDQRRAQQKSILDFVLDDAGKANRSLAREDRAKLEEYLTSLREVERRIAMTESRPAPNLGGGIDVPAGIPDDYSDHVPLMFDMLLLAFQTDQTRIATLMLAHEASNRPMPFLNIAEGHHQLSHHNNNPDAVNKVKTIDHWYVQQFARFLQRMNDVRDLDGQSLLHNSMILYGSGISDGNKHWHTNLPILLAGSGGGTLSPGRYVRSAQTPITNCYLSLADRMGCSLEAHGDSTGRIAGIV
jgi:hypothetical protein